MLTILLYLFHSRGRRADSGGAGTGTLRTLRTLPTCGLFRWRQSERPRDFSAL